MVEVDRACELMHQALEILDANGAHQSAALLDSAILALPVDVTNPHSAPNGDPAANLS